MDDEMKKLFEEINAFYVRFKSDAEQRIKGNKAAGARSRKATLAMTKAMKAWRKASM